MVDYCHMVSGGKGGRRFLLPLCMGVAVNWWRGDKAALDFCTCDRSKRVPAAVADELRELECEIAKIKQRIEKLES